MIRLVVIGAGGHARSVHAPSLALYRDEHPGEIELAAVCDLDEARVAALQREFGFGAAYTDVDAMIDAERPDAIVGVLPVPQIAPVGVRLLERGIPCVIEKPPGDSPEAARRLLDAARSTGAPHMVSVNRRFVPCLERAREWAAGVGPVRFVRASMLRVRRSEDNFIYGTAVHAVDALRHVAGDVRECRARICSGGGLSAAWFEVEFRFEGGCAGALHVFPTTGAEEESYELFGEGFRTRSVLPTWGGRGASVECYRDGDLVVSERTPEGAPLVTIDGSYHETCAFVRALRDATPLWPTLEDVVPSLDLCFRIDASSSRQDIWGSKEVPTG